MCIQNEVSIKINHSAPAAHGLKLLRRHEVRACARVLCQLRHAFSAIEIDDGGDHGFALCLRFREPDDVFKFTVGNIDSGFPDANLA